MTLVEVKSDRKHYYENEHGKKHGEFKSWYDNGLLDIHCFYDNGNRHGEYKVWWENGQMYLHCFYDNGKRHGEYKTWLKNGRTYRHTYYYKGKDLEVDPSTLSQEDIFYIELTGELP